MDFVVFMLCVDGFYFVDFNLCNSIFSVVVVCCRCMLLFLFLVI